MNPDNIKDKSSISATGKHRSESISVYILVATVFLAPLVFWPSQYYVPDMVKTLVISVGTLASAVFCLVVALKERKIGLPPRSLFWTGFLLSVSLIISSLASIQVAKSFMGRGFEIGTTGFILVVFVSGLIAYALTVRKSERAILIYMAAFSSYILLFVFQILRLIFGQGFVSLSILNSVTDSVLGSWSSFGLYSAVILLVSFTALFVLPLSKIMRNLYIALAVMGAAGIFLVDSPVIWFFVSLILLGFTIAMSAAKPRIGTGFFRPLLRRMAWLPLLMFIISGVLVWQGNNWSAPILHKLKAQNNEIALPWQMTLDVAAGSIKNYPIFGVGPNHFTEAYLAYKPAGINQGDGWGIEFSSGFGLLPTFVATQGLVGTILWILFLVFFGILGARAMRRLPDEPVGRFIMISSLASSAFLWMSAILFVPAHAILFLTLVLTGVFAGSAVSFGSLPDHTISPSIGRRLYKLFPSFAAFFIIIAIVLGLAYVKNAVALSYLGLGMKQLTAAGNPNTAAAYFKDALAIDRSDIYWQAQTEAALAQANMLVATITSQTSSSTSESIVSKASNYINSALSDSRNAVSYDPTNYYNYVSEARVFEAAINFNMQNSYNGAVQAYTTAIKLNPYNPSLYLDLAKLQASHNKLDDALKTIGAALQVKSNYLDAIFLLSQVDAAKGNLPEAITAAQYAIEINPDNSLLYFQLGLLQYNSKDYRSAAAALNQAIKIQPDYANAQYFLGLADSRLGDNSGAIEQFNKLAQTNPGNQEVVQILANLKAGKSIFTDSVPPTAPNPAKRPTLPIKENR